jgi:hypothetical protein
LCDLDGFTVKEVAHILGLAEGTVKAQIWRARAKLTRLMRRALRPRLEPVLPRPSLTGAPRGRRPEQIPSTSAEPCAP